MQMVLGDAWQHYDTDYHRNNGNLELEYCEYLALRHNNKANLNFADGHVGKGDISITVSTANTWKNYPWNMFQIAE